MSTVNLVEKCGHFLVSDDNGSSIHFKIMCKKTELKLRIFSVFWNFIAVTVFGALDKKTIAKHRDDSGENAFQPRWLNLSFCPYIVTARNEVGARLCFYRCV